MNIAAAFHSPLKPQPSPNQGPRPGSNSRLPQNPLSAPPSIRDSFQPSSEGRSILEILESQSTIRMESGNDTFEYKQKEQTPTNRGRAIAEAASRAIEAARASGGSEKQEIRSSGPLSNLLRNALPSTEQEGPQHSPGPISGGVLRFLEGQKDTVEGPRPNLPRPLPRNHGLQDRVTQYLKA